MSVTGRKQTAPQRGLRGRSLRAGAEAPGARGGGGSPRTCGRRPPAHLRRDGGASSHAAPPPPEVWWSVVEGRFRCVFWKLVVALDVDFDRVIKFDFYFRINFSTIKLL